jgi:hypothetical protein
MKKFIPLFALTAVILTACPPPPPAGTSIPTSGGTVSSSDNQASFVAPNATAGTFANVTASNDLGSIPSGLTFVKAYNFAVTAGSVASATISIQFAAPVTAVPSSRKVAVAINRLYKRDGAFWRYVDGQTSTSTSVSATVTGYGVYGVLSGIATIKDIVVTPNPVNINLSGSQAITQQMTAVVRDSLDQPMPAVDSAVTWILGSALLSGSQVSQQAVLVAPVGNAIDNSTGLLTARVAATDTIIATGGQNKQSAPVPLNITGSLVIVK